MFGGGGIDYRDCLPRFPLLPGQPDRLLAELLEAQTALAIVAYYVGCRQAYPFTGSTLPSRHYFCAADEALREARDIVGRVIEEVRIQMAETPLNADEKTPDE